VYVYMSFSLQGFPQHFPGSLYRGGCRANRCTLLDVARIAQERSYRYRDSTADSQEAVLREKEEGRTLSLIIDKVKTGEYMGYLGSLIYLWGCDDSSVCHRGVTTVSNIS
jgi:hypothetical protein